MRRPGHLDFERWLLHRGLGTLVAGRCTCSRCRRTPLVGERTYRYQSGRVLCELCRRLRREEPISSELVRSTESGQAVRLRAA
jgi:hypothetical protein